MERHQRSKLGVKLNYKNYETRYDAAQVASLWPESNRNWTRLRSSALADRMLPPFPAPAGRQDPDVHGEQPPTAMPGNPTRDFHPRPTYSHESAGFLSWMREQRGGDEPLKVAILASEASPASAAYVDMAKGLELYAEEHPEELDLVEIIYTEVQPRDLTAQMRRVARAGAEALIVQTNTSIVVAAKRGLQANGADIPIMMISHNGLPASGGALGDLISSKRLRGLRHGSCCG
ncbi:type 1 periplasmic-binding domain-containing protein [Pseudosulfitobacter pseudonitzschiae]|uniref:ABC transporter substrate-binding protein n=1 Tax=Pseudosulfitobacter pseudonitzschiae TaxID=1402135 RepID=UPI0029677947|nr:ABC transporter substrate-binding protein [Pseudosulfitobacter pseudonitzschiae]